VHPDKSPACDVVGVRLIWVMFLVLSWSTVLFAYVLAVLVLVFNFYNLLLCMRKRMWLVVGCLCSLAGSGLSMFPSWWLLWARRRRAPRTWETSEKQVVWSLRSLENSTVFICCQRTQAAQKNE
jgi:hypothetical protein